MTAPDETLEAVARVVEPRLRPTPRGLQPFTGEYGRWNQAIDESPDREYAAFLDVQVHLAVRAGRRRDLLRWLITTALGLAIAVLACVAGRGPNRYVAAGAVLTAVVVGVARTIRWAQIEGAHLAVCPRQDVPDVRPS